jgi:hypothetical protein
MLLLVPFFSLSLQIVGFALAWRWGEETHEQAIVA